MAIEIEQSEFPAIDEVILDAYKKAGLLPIEYGIGSDIQWQAKAAHGRRTLNRLLNSYSTHRFFEYFQRFAVVQMVVGQSSYALTVDILNIIDDGSYIPQSNDPEETDTTGETPVKPMSAFRWNQLSSKASSGTPVHYYIERGQLLSSAGPLTLHVWPMPSEAGKIRFRAHRIPGDSSIGDSNPDFKRHWELWAVYALAYEFATDSSMGFEDRKLLRADRDEAFEVLKAYDTMNTPPDTIFVHSTPWSGHCL